MGVTPVVIGPESLATNRNAKIGRPQFSSNQGVLISRKQYLIAYNKDKRVLDWALWQFSPADLGRAKREDAFAPDPDLEKAGITPVKNEDYGKSCFSRGHQIPSSDRKSSPNDNLATFFMSNMLPQTSYLNSFIWKSLEVHSYNLVEKGKTLYILAGPIHGPQKRGIGLGRDISVPVKNWKVVADDSGQVIAAVIMPNTTSKGTDPLDDLGTACDELKDQSLIGKTPSWQAFAATREDIEREAHVDLSFFRF